MNLHFDIFSGNPNPSIQLPSVIGQKVFELIKDSRLIPQATSTAFPGRLGYRGFSIDLPMDLAMRYHMPPKLHFPAEDVSHYALLMALSGILPFTIFGAVEIQRVLKLCLDFLRTRASATAAAAAAPGPATMMGPCSFEELPYAPDRWNDPAYIRTNNCYAYASNKLALYRSKPQPGVGSGAKYTSDSGPDVAAAAKRDGAHDISNCFPDSEVPRLLVALVIWPGEDYHWYRKHPTCWGHKPGSTPARNVDNSGHIITNPQTCDRGPYTEFTGYMLIPKSQKVAA